MRIDHQPTVKELIQLLSEMNPDAEVVVREDGSTGAIIGLREVGDPDELNALFDDFTVIPGRAVVIEVEF